MRRNLAIAGGAILLVVAIISGVTMLDSPSEPSDNHTTDAPDGPENPIEAPSENNTTVPPAPPVYAPNDPGRHSYPANPSSAEEELVGSQALSNHIIDQINYRRGQEDLDALHKSATLDSNTRAHSLDMYNRSYFDTTSPDGVTPVERYNGTATNCSVVTEYVFQETYIVETADGDKKHIDSGQIAASVFSEMMGNETMLDTMLSEDYTHVGAGTYFTPEETDTGATRLNVHVTVDYCRV